MTTTANNELVEYDPVTGEVIEAEPFNQLVQDAEDDFAIARQTLKDILADALETAKESGVVARTSQNSNSFMAAAKLVDTVSQATQDLMDLHIKRQSMTPAVEEAPKEKIVNNNLFVGSVDDLLRKLKPSAEDNFE